jgi:hypothetical protein
VNTNVVENIVRALALVVASIQVVLVPLLQKNIILINYMFGSLASKEYHPY